MREQGRGRRCVLLGCVAALCAPGVAGAHGPSDGTTRPLSADERARVLAEAQMLGLDHALQHAAARQAPSLPPAPPGGDPGFDPCRPRGDANAFDFSRPRPPAGLPTGQDRCSELPRQPRTREKLAQVGRWTKDVVDLPHYAIHATLLPTGKVLFWGYEWTQNLITRTPNSHQETSSASTLWDPSKGTGPDSLRAVPAPRIDIDGDGVPERVPLYCSGQTLLPDGRVLVTGGTLDLRWAERGYTNPPGIKTVLVFDPWKEDWVRSEDMTVARWYPTQTKLADGRTVVLGGYDDRKPTDFTGTLDVVSRDGRKVRHASSGDRRTWTYPQMLLMPSSRVLLAGPLKDDAGLLDPEKMRWRRAPSLPRNRGGANIVPVPTRSGSSPRAMLIGGADFLRPVRGEEARAYRTTLVLDERRLSRGWKRAPAQRRGRYWPNTVLLPDGSMVTLGGARGHTKADAAFAAARGNRRVELWNPRTRRWRLGPAQREDRTYHSVALLLPDGRVWSAGDDGNPNRDGDTAEVYEPPYLFRGSRPRIVRAPKRLRADGRTFTIRARGRVPRRVTLLAPGATTHALDMNQRFVELEIVRRRTTSRGTHVLTVRGPRSSAVAPPGPWMLFALSERGAPSVGKWTSVTGRGSARR